MGESPLPPGMGHWNSSDLTMGHTYTTRQENVLFMLYIRRGCVNDWEINSMASDLSGILWSVL